MLVLTYIASGLAVVASNYIYQAMLVATPDWAEATERSFFQVVALVIVGVTILIRRIA